MIGWGSQRWAVSLADLFALLLGFFVIVSADARVRDRALGGVAQALGAQPHGPRARRLAPDAFLAGDARLTSRGRRQVAEAAATAQARGGRVRVVASGRPPGTDRFDGWELAAARAAVVARGLREAGVDDRRIAVVVDGTAPGPGPAGIDIALVR